MQIFEVEDSKVAIKVAGLIRGEGVDLAVHALGHRPRTVQLTAANARELADALRTAANESELDMDRVK